MTYEEFCCELLQRLEDRKDELGYDRVKYYTDGFTSEEPEELMTIRNTNIRYNKMESDVLSGDFVILYIQTGSVHICRFTCRGLYRAFEENGWKGVWTDINSSLEEGKQFAKMDIMELIDRNEYEALREKIFIRPLNYNDHRDELKDYVYRRVGDIVLVLYLLAGDERTGERHDVSSMKLPRVMMDTWDLTEEEVWENAMSSTYMMSPPRMYLNPMDTYKPPYHKGAFSPRQILERVKEMNRMLDPSEVLTRKVYLYEAASKEFRQLEL